MENRAGAAAGVADALKSEMFMAATQQKAAVQPKSRSQECTGCGSRDCGLIRLGGQRIGQRLADQ